MATARWANITENLHVRLFAVVHTPLPRGTWDSQNVCDSFWRFYVNDRDGASLILPGSTYPLRAGRMYFVPEEVLFSCHNDKTVEHFYIHFDVLGLSRSVLTRLFAGPIEIGAVTPQVEKLAEITRRSKEPDVVMQCQAQSVLFESLSEVFIRARSEEELDYTQLTLRHEPVAPALEYIEENLSNALDNRVLAGCCHWSEDHFARRFRECVGQTPAQYVQERRVATASQQLLFTGKTIEEIARDTGFADRFHFSRVFARQKNCGPATYRKATRV